MSKLTNVAVESMWKLCTVVYCCIMFSAATKNIRLNGWEGEFVVFLFSLVSLHLVAVLCMIKLQGLLGSCPKMFKARTFNVNIMAALHTASDITDKSQIGGAFK